MKTSNGISVVFGAITVDSINDSFKKGLKQAQLRQLVTTSYPSARIDDELKDSLYTKEELKIEDKEYHNERVTWIPVNLDSTVESVTADLAARAPEGRIFRVLSLSPIVSTAQRRVIENGLTGEAFEDFKEKHGIESEEWTKECSQIIYDGIEARQLVVYGENNKENMDADAPVLFNGKKQYKELSFSLTPKSDIDYRGEEKQETPSMTITEELVSAGETVKS